MKKMICIFLFLFSVSFLYSLDLNIMTVSGGVISGELIGSDDNSVFIKTSDGNAKTVKYEKINRIFDSNTKKDVTSEYKKQAAPKPESSAAGAVKPAEKNNQEYETIEVNSGSINLRRGSGIFVRTVPKYFGFDIGILDINLLFSGDNTRMKKTLKSYAVHSGGYTYDDGTFMLSSGFNGSFYVRPIDCLAFGAFYAVSPMNQNLQVYRGSTDKFMYIDMPSTDYGFLLKFIPYSTAVTGSDGEPVENCAVGVDFKLGAATLGTFFGGASINDEASSGDAVNLSGTAPYLAVEFVVSSQQDYMKFGIGYQQSVFNEIKADKAYPNIALADGDNYYVADADGKIPFSIQGIYTYLAIAF
jgi:hypothetical protein